MKIKKAIGIGFLIAGVSTAFSATPLEHAENPIKNQLTQKPLISTIDTMNKKIVDDMPSQGIIPKEDEIFYLGTLFVNELKNVAPSQKSMVDSLFDDAISELENINSIRAWFNIIELGMLYSATVNSGLGDRSGELREVKVLQTSLKYIDKLIDIENNGDVKQKNELKNINTIGISLRETKDIIVDRIYQLNVFASRDFNDALKYLNHFNDRPYRQSKVLLNLFLTLNPEFYDDIDSLFDVNLTKLEDENTRSSYEKALELVTRYNKAVAIDGRPVNRTYQRIIRVTERGINYIDNIINIIKVDSTISKNEKEEKINNLLNLKKGLIEYKNDLQNETSESYKSVYGKIYSSDDAHTRVFNIVSDYLILPTSEYNKLDSLFDDAIEKLIDDGRYDVAVGDFNHYLTKLSWLLPPERFIDSFSSLINGLKSRFDSLENPKEKSKFIDVIKNSVMDLKETLLSKLKNGSGEVIDEVNNVDLSWLEQQEFLPRLKTSDMFWKVSKVEDPEFDFSIQMYLDSYQDNGPVVDTIIISKIDSLSNSPDIDTLLYSLQCLVHHYAINKEYWNSEESMKLLILNKALGLCDKILKFQLNDTETIKKVEDIKVKIENEIKNINMGD
ncbi:hypothetical protein J7J90_03110 [Candidatus Micrarchaeota archaeon]|nr:hypothetical protein [Candidatus Micrarchaeota archaeon]